MATNAANSVQNLRSGEKDKIPLTREGYEEKKARYEYLVNVLRREVADYIHEAKEAGDVSESSAYEDAKNRQAMVEGEIQELQHVLEHAVILEAPKEVDGRRVISLGSTVEVETDRGTKRTFTLVSTVEANSTNNKLSNESPVGKALMGHTEGDQVEVTLPNNSVVTYTIKAIR